MHAGVSAHGDHHSSMSHWTSNQTACWDGYKWFPYFSRTATYLVQKAEALLKSSSFLSYLPQIIITADRWFWFIITADHWYWCWMDNKKMKISIFMPFQLVSETSNHPFIQNIQNSMQIKFHPRVPAVVQLVKEMCKVMVAGVQIRCKCATREKQ